MTNHRIRVLVAGDVYANRALVRRFLEDDGYEVAGEAFERADLMPQVIRGQPDAVVLDEAILSGRRNGKTLQRIRRAAPEAKLIVLTATPGAAAFADADATLEAGLSLAALTGLLGRLFAEDAEAPAGALTAGVVTGTGVPAAAAAASSTARTEPRGSVARFIASVGLPLVVVWSLIAMFTTGGRAPFADGDRENVAAGGVAVVPITDGPLKGAQDSLDRLLHAIRAGNPVLATVHAQALMDARASATSLGYPVDALDSNVRSRLSAVVGLLSPGPVGALSGILDGLFPEIQGAAGSPGGGSGLILGSAASSADGAEAVLTGGLGGGGNGADAGSDGQGLADGEGNGVGRDGEGDGDGEGEAELGPGGGRAWGQSHNHAEEEGGEAFGSDGDEVHGRSDEAPGHDEHHHPHGHAWGHQKHRGHGDGDERGEED